GELASQIGQRRRRDTVLARRRAQGVDAILDRFERAATIGELARLMIESAKQFPSLRERANATEITSVTSADYYGKYYQDIQTRVPAIDAARQSLGWAPSTDLATAVRKTIDYYVRLENEQRRSVSKIA
ncbi:MAG TPA: hypothetical protein P5528_17135, partial [Steroidobacteraceae bacterium]|nr:hypothetical protein [Steroidobacteraceae bacterium]